MRTEQTFAELSRSAPYAPHTRDSPHPQSRSPRRTGIVSGRSPRCHAAARSSFSAPRITILSASSGSGRCSASPRPTARASGHRALRRYHRHGLGMDRLHNRDAPPWVYLNVLFQRVAFADSPTPSPDATGAARDGRARRAAQASDDVTLPERGTHAPLLGL